MHKTAYYNKEYVYTNKLEQKLFSLNTCKFQN